MNLAQLFSAAVLIFIGICIAGSIVVIGVERLAVAINDRRDRQHQLGRSLLGRRLKVLRPGPGDAVFIGRGAQWSVDSDGVVELHLVSIIGAPIPGLGRALLDTEAITGSRLIVSIAGPLEPGDFERPDRSAQRAGP